MSRHPNPGPRGQSDLTGRKRGDAKVLQQPILAQEVDIEGDAIVILWNDGHRGIYPHRYLRLRCQCANCVDEMSGNPRLDPDSVPLGGAGGGPDAGRQLRRAVPMERCPLHRPVSLPVPAFRLHLYRLQSGPERDARQVSRGCSEVAWDGILDWRAREPLNRTPEIPMVLPLSLNPPSFSPLRESRALFMCSDGCADRYTPGVGRPPPRHCRCSEIDVGQLKCPAKLPQTPTNRSYSDSGLRS